MTSPIIGFSAFDNGNGILPLAATPDGPLVSLDAGSTWQPLTPASPSPVFALAAVASEDTVEILLAGTPSGLMRSSDAGNTWQLPLSSSPVTTIASSRLDDASTLVLAGTESDGLFRSTDHGATWAAASPGLLDLEILAIAVSPTFETDKTIICGTASGIYRSRNGGKAWSPLTLPVGEIAVQCVALQSGSLNGSSRLWAGTEGAGLWCFRDGDTWQLDETHAAGTDVTSIAVSPDQPHVVYIATQHGVFRSCDAGQSWERIHHAQDILCLMLFRRGDAEIILVGSATTGILRSVDAGETWQVTTHCLKWNPENSCANR